MVVVEELLNPMMRVNVFRNGKNAIKNDEVKLL